MERPRVSTDDPQKGAATEAGLSTGLRSMLFRGREVTHADVGKEIMMRMAGELEELGLLDSPPKGACARAR